MIERLRSFSFLLKHPVPLAAIYLLISSGIFMPDQRSTVHSSSLQAGPAAASPAGEVEAVLDTSRGEIVVEFFHKDAPKHVEYFLNQAKSGAYDGTTFHRVVENAMVQGGDPLSKNPRQRAQYGTGGLNAGIPDEINRNKHITGALSAMLQLNPANQNEVKPGSSGSQFFIVLNAGVAKTQLDSKYTVFGRVVEGLDVVTAISTSSTARAGGASERIEVRKVSIREKKPSVEDMKAMRVMIETSLGTMKLQLAPESVPATSREFVRFVKAGLYDGVSFYRVSQKYYLEAGFLDSWPSDSPNRKRFFSLWPTQIEKSDRKHVRGTLSMRSTGEGTTSWYFFIISKDNPALDGQHTPIGTIVEGLEVVDKIAAVDVDGDKPKERIEIRKISIQ